MEKHLIVLTIILGFHLLPTCTASYSGPFLLWGDGELSGHNKASLQSMDNQMLQEIYSNATAVLVFLKNSTTKLNYENFPKLSDIIANKIWIYLPQEQLSSDPLEHNINAEIITLTGPADQQDTEIAALYKDAEINYGVDKVLGILANRVENHGHIIAKRQAEPAPTTTSTMEPLSSSTVGPEPIEENLIFLAKEKGILYTTDAPFLTIATNESMKSYDLKSHTLVVADERENLFKLIINFLTVDGKFTLKFRFKIAYDYWTLNEIEFDDGSLKPIVLDVIGDAPAAPIGFSYKCGGKFTYRKGAVSLVLKNIQVQPMLNGASKFSDAVDCVGIMSAPILSGVFVTALLGLIMTIAITCILDIKPPTRFENRSSKQLTFTVQE